LTLRRQHLQRLANDVLRPAEAFFYSLIESAKLAGVEPRAHLGQAARRAIRNRGAVTLERNLKYLESLGS
jgi:hypothetical protein